MNIRLGDSNFFSQDILGLGVSGDISPGAVDLASTMVARIKELRARGVQLNEMTLYVDDPGYVPVALALRELLEPGTIQFAYGHNLEYYDTFFRNVFVLVQDDLYTKSDGILVLGSEDRFFHQIRMLKSEHATRQQLILPLLPPGLYDSSAIEAPSPLVLWATQFSGTLRAAPVFVEIMKHYDRAMLPMERNVWYSSRYLRNLHHHGIAAEYEPNNALASYLRGSDSAFEIDPNDHVTYFKREFLNIPDYRWMLCHEFIPFSAMEPLGDLKLVALIRDPRDVLTSCYYRMVADPRDFPEDNPQGYLRDRLTPQFAEYSSEQFREKALLMMIEGLVLSKTTRQHTYWPSIRSLAESFLAASRSPNVFDLRFENLRVDPAPVYQRLIEWMALRPKELAPSAEDIESFCQKGTIEFQTGGLVKDGDTSYPTTRFDSKSGLPHAGRSGASGSWRKAFTPKVTAVVKERIGELLIELGYESDLSW